MSNYNQRMLRIKNMCEEQVSKKSNRFKIIKGVKNAKTNKEVHTEDSK